MSQSAIQRLLPPPLTPEQYEELGASIRGPVHLRGDPSFMDYATVFNGNVMSLAKAVTCPLDAEDVSKIIVFCRKHNLFPSIKAGGYGTAGWAIGGDIILDLSKLVEVDIEVPSEDGSFTSLKDVSSANSKGKRAVVPSASTGASSTGKRRREEDAALRSYDLASLAVASFLRGPPPADTRGDYPPPSVKRRLDSDSSSSGSPGPNYDLDIASMTRPTAAPSPMDTGSHGPSLPLSPRSTLATAPSSPARSASSCQTANRPGGQRFGDPFGFLDTPSGSSSVPPVVIHSSFNPPAPLRGWGQPPSNPGDLLGFGMSMQQSAEPLHRHAFVTFGAGMRQKEIDRFASRNKLEAKNSVGEGIPYHVPFAAHPVGSSIMILGGFGFLSRLHGLSVDNLVEVEMVLADGRIVVASEEDYPDLWWAVRGAGPALGVATRYKARAYPVPVVFAGNLIYRFNRSTTPSLIRHFRDCVKGAPRELYTNVLLTAGPADKDSIVVIQMCYVGNKEAGQEFLSAISSWDGEKCLLNEVNEKSFLHQQDSVAQVLRGKPGRQWFIRSALISSLPDDVINETVNQFADTPVGCTWLFELAGGAVSDFESSCIPKSQREAAFTIAALHQWEMDIDDDRCIDAAEEWIADTLKPVQLGGPLPSFLGRLEPPERTKACFGENWERLCEVKQKYDPDNLFKYSFWPLNEKGEAVEPNTHEPPLPPNLRR
ncbi:hypothetical protein AX16_000900 [Volvariella volvacea WC 439]|nr:hypothetical protein AX16_000900 [Volvariella volvacea WC 439]